MHRSFIFLAEGFEEIEALTVVDVMRRAGMDLKTVSITSDKKVIGAHGIPVYADITFKEADFEDSEWLILPGGNPFAILSKSTKANWRPSALLLPWFSRLLAYSLEKKPHVTPVSNKP